MSADWWEDDDHLLAALREAEQAVSAVPAEAVEAAKAVFSWHDADAELALLVYDSALDDQLLATVRGGRRVLIFELRDQTLEVEVGPDALLGQFQPPRYGTVVKRQRDGEQVSSTVDSTGCFVIQPAPSGGFCLSWSYEGRSVRTGWLR
ncbi:hypothetical protein [Nonomuraea sp. NPDC003201]